MPIVDKQRFLCRKKCERMGREKCEICYFANFGEKYFTIDILRRTRCTRLRDQRKKRWKMKRTLVALALLAAVSCMSAPKHGRPPIDPGDDPSPIKELQCPGGRIIVGDCQRTVIDRCDLPIWWRPGPWGFTASRPVREGWIYRVEGKYYQLAFEYGAIFYIKETEKPLGTEFGKGE
jgi:hypothetical protein